MKRIGSALVVTLVLAALTFGSVLAASPHFLKASDSVNASGQLVISWKEAGLGDDVLVGYLATADGSATWACFNKGGNHPQASNKESVDAPLEASGTFGSEKNGSITASLVMGPVSPGSFSCPSGQILRLMDVSYSNIVLTDTSNGISTDLPDVSRVLYP